MKQVWGQSMESFVIDLTKPNELEQLQLNIIPGVLYTLHIVAPKGLLVSGYSRLSRGKGKGVEFEEKSVEKDHVTYPYRVRESASKTAVVNFILYTRWPGEANQDPIIIRCTIQRS